MVVRFRRKSLILSTISGALFVAGLAAGCGTSAASEEGAKAATTQVDDAKQAANPSGTLTVYGALTSANGDALAKAFEAYDANAKVNIITGGTGDLVTRIEAEAKAKSLHADVVLLADPTVMPNLANEHILSSYKPASATNLPSSLQGQDWVGAFTFHNVIIYHKGMSLPTPTSWTDLTKATYKGQLELGDPSYSGTTLGMVGYLSSKYGWRYFQDLRQNNATTQSSTNTVGTDVASGRVDVGISLDSVANSLIAQGSPVGIVWPKDGAIPVPAPVSIVAGKENALSKAFVDWLLSPAGQSEVSHLGLAPVSGSSNLVPQNATMASIDWSQIGQQRTTTINQFESIFSK